MNMKGRENPSRRAAKRGAEKPLNNGLE